MNMPIKTQSQGFEDLNLFIWKEPLKELHEFVSSEPMTNTENKTEHLHRSLMQDSLFRSNSFVWLNRKKKNGYEIK